MASSLPSLQVRKGSAVNEFLGRLIEIMAEVGTRSSMTSNHGRGHAHHHQQASGVGLSVNNFYAGGFLHADDIRTLATSEASLRYQIDLVKAFAEQNLLKLNVSKCEIVVFSKQPSKALPVCEVDGSVMPAGDVGKCLGYWWKGDLSASRSVEENIRKARRAFFHFGSIGSSLPR